MHAYVRAQADGPDENQREKGDGHGVLSRGRMTRRNEALLCPVCKQTPSRLLQPPLYPFSVSLLPEQTCWKLHLMLQLRSGEELEPRSAVRRAARQKWRDFTLGRQRGSWMETQLGYLCISFAECMKVAACVQLLLGTSEATIGRVIIVRKLELQVCNVHYFHQVRFSQKKSS